MLAQGTTGRASSALMIVARGGAARSRAAVQAPEIAPFEPQHDIGLVERRIHFLEGCATLQMTQSRTVRQRCRAGPTFRLRIWGPGVRISSGAPAISMAYVESAVLNQKLERCLE